MNINSVLENCKEYVEILKKGEKGCFLVRAVKGEIFQIKEYQSKIATRIPKDMPLNYHNAINEHFKNIFGWNVRNGVFSYSLKHNIETSTSNYGALYLLFPCGKFSYIYDPDVYDLFITLFEFSETNNRLTSFINSINYVDYGLNDAMSTNIHNGSSAEIIINCKYYYLVNTKYVKELTDLIWKK